MTHEIQPVVLKRRQSDPDTVAGVPSPPPPLLKYQYLWAFLAYSSWETGQARTPGTVTLFSERGVLKAALNDRDSGEVGFVTLDGSADPLGTLDGLLRDERVDWRRPTRAHKYQRGPA